MKLPLRQQGKDIIDADGYRLFKGCGEADSALAAMIVAKFNTKKTWECNGNWFDCPNSPCQAMMDCVKYSHEPQKEQP